VISNGRGVMSNFNREVRVTGASIDGPKAPLAESAALKPMTDER